MLHDYTLFELVFSVLLYVYNRFCYTAVSFSFSRLCRVVRMNILTLILAQNISRFV